MRLAIDGREISVNHPGGLRTYTESIVSSLAEHGEGMALTVYLDRPGTGPSAHGIEYRVCPPAQLPFREQFSLPRMLKDHRADLAHFPANTAPVRCPAPYVLTLHDTFCMERSLWSIASSGGPHNKLLSLYSKVVPFVAARRARRVITVSRYSARQIARVLKLNAAELAVVPPVLSPRYRRADATGLRREVTEALGVSRLALVIGSAEPRKNLANVLRAFALASERDSQLGLVVTWPSGTGFRQWAERAVGQVPQRTHVAVGVSNDDLVRLYSCADVFMFVSRREGFGLPVVEAMACGCPVVTSGTTCLPDTAGGAALLADPGDPRDIAARLLELVQDDGLRQSLTQAGLAQAAEFSPLRAAEGLIGCYISALRRQTHPAPHLSEEVTRI